MWAEIASTGLPPHGGQPVKSTQEAPRSQFIVYYDMPTILLEPLFISNTDQASWIHDSGNSQLLAAAIARAIKGQFLSGGPIGLSPGHAYKTSQPTDPGSTCALGDTERDHTLALVDLVSQQL
jgi:hypothetical protein